MKKVKGYVIESGIEELRRGDIDSLIVTRAPGVEMDFAVTLSPVGQDEPDYKAMWEDLETEATTHHTKAVRRCWKNVEQFWFNLIRGMTKLKAKHTLCPEEDTSRKSRTKVREKGGKSETR